MVLVLIPTSIDLDLPNMPGVEFALYDPARPVPCELAHAQGIVAWRNKLPQLQDCARRLTNLRWIGALSAGVDRVLAAGFPANVVVTSGRGLHDICVAEHAMSLILALVRQLPRAARAQAEHRWAAELARTAPVAQPADEVRSLAGARVGIWGFGSIGRTLATRLAVFGADVVGVDLASGEVDGVPVIAADRIEETLPDLDVLVLTLPAEDATVHALDAERIALLPARARVVNVGRGAVVDTAALAEALVTERLAGAGLDVFETEPLPEDSPLWDLPNAILTPHIAGGQPIGAERVVVAGAAALVGRGTFVNAVPR